MKYLRQDGMRFGDEERPGIGFYISVGGGIGNIDGAGAMQLIESRGEKMMFGCVPDMLHKYLGTASRCQYFIAYQSKAGFSETEYHRAHEPQEGGRIKGIYKVVGAPKVQYEGEDRHPVVVPEAIDGSFVSAEEMVGLGVHTCVVTIAVIKITAGCNGDGVKFGTTDSFDIKCSDGNPPKIWTPIAGSEVVAADCMPAPPNWTDVAGATTNVGFRGAIGCITRGNWRYHKICEFMRNHRLGPWAP